VPLCPNPCWNSLRDSSGVKSIVEKT
jgi:hypothetical protein